MSCGVNWIIISIVLGSVNLIIRLIWHQYCDERQRENVSSSPEASLESAQYQNIIHSHHYFQITIH